jgi:putative NIF3 family GTP cyclohydrolase 1 type 2
MIAKICYQLIKQRKRIEEQLPQWHEDSRKIIIFEQLQISTIMPKIKDIVEYLEAWAPPTFQEPYDNAGLITGDMSEEVTGVVIALDCIEAVVEDAIGKNCNLVVAHHPIIFKGIKKLTGKNYIEKTIIKAVRHDIAIFAIHTNLDHISTGVNNEIARRVGLQKCKILRPKKDTLAKLTTFVPNNDTDKVLAALHKAGAGMIGNYHSCSFRVSGTGTFLPMEEANPSIGSKGQLEEVHEKPHRSYFSRPYQIKNSKSPVRGASL